MEDRAKAAEQLRKKCENDSENGAAWQEYAQYILTCMEETHVPVLSCSPLFDVKQVLEKAAEADTENTRFGTLRNRAYKSIAAEAVAGKAKLYEAALPLIHDGRIDPAAWKQALTGTAPSLSRIVRAGETAAQELQSRGICFDGDPRSMCWTLVEPQEGHPILTPVFVLCDLLIAAETPEDASSMTAIQLAKPASASEDFYSSAADEAVEQWNDLKYCPYCFGRDLRMTMSGRRRCKACRAVIKPFEIYRPQ
ncbi:MAG: hypothetical protein IKG46_02095 [Solobacterium sp.]|nr:hypothetical protein [Solobacterium sp.]